MIRKIEIERFTLTSSKPFDGIVAALNATVGHPDIVEFWRATQRTRALAELESTIEKAVGRTGLILFAEFDHGAIVRKDTGRDTSKIVRLVIGNPLIMRRMVEHVPDAGSYAPVTILIDERPDGVHLSYDRMASFLAAYKNADALKVAGELDAKIETLLTSIA
jgi:uncharacterized protein (DUF302 family)